MFMQAISCQFTGNAKEYTYVAAHPEHPVNVVPGDRVVVINKIKDDGTVSLSIATVVKLVDLKDGELPMPIVDIISRENLKNATAIYSKAGAAA